MAFNSYTFIIFFGLVLFLHYLPFGWRSKKINLLLASYIFYAAYNPPCVLLLLLCTLTDWFSARRIHDAETKKGKNLFLLLSLAINLGMLAFFKYSNFFIENFIHLLRLLDIHFQPLKPDIILPLGISFFTFQSLTYTIDIYRNNEKPWPSFLDYALFVTFFPKLVNGPITRAFDFLKQCDTPRKMISSTMAWGLFLLLLGLFEKIVVADGLLGPVTDEVFGSSAAPNFISAWTGALAFTGQIFFDFAGYSSCAIGVALCLGFELPLNFKFPYAAIGFSDFWRRWHISLSSWLRDYLYISLGGNRIGKIRTDINIMVTMLLGGLWHGASWTFVVWGGLHGLYQIIERFLKDHVPASPLWKTLPFRISLAVFTFLMVNFTWVFFRAETFSQAFTILISMFALDSSPGQFSIESIYVSMTLLILVATFVVHWFMRDQSLKDVIDNLPWWTRSLLIASMIIAIVVCSGDDRSFIYFQF
jgi:D-alanyl-lipoteichoic acid acyltransferase DltB (MBOAT superfamily)